MLSQRVNPQKRQANITHPQAVKLVSADIEPGKVLQVSYSRHVLDVIVVQAEILKAAQLGHRSDESDVIALKAKRGQRLCTALSQLRLGMELVVVAVMKRPLRTSTQ